MVDKHKLWLRKLTSEDCEVGLCELGGLNTIIQNSELFQGTCCYSFTAGLPAPIIHMFTIDQYIVFSEITWIQETIIAGTEKRVHNK
jgi:hypothetical protein